MHVHDVNFVLFSLTHSLSHTVITLILTHTLTLSLHTQAVIIDSNFFPLSTHILLYKPHHTLTLSHHPHSHTHTNTNTHTMMRRPFSSIFVSLMEKYDKKGTMMKRPYIFVGLSVQQIEKFAGKGKEGENKQVLAFLTKTLPDTAYLPSSLPC